MTPTRCQFYRGEQCAAAPEVLVFYRTSTGHTAQTAVCRQHKRYIENLTHVYGSVPIMPANVGQTAPSGDREVQR